MNFNNTTSQRLFADKSPVEIERYFNVSISQGLSTAYVQKLAKSSDTTVLKYYATNWPIIFIRQWKSPFIYLLCCAAVLSFYLGDYANAIVIVVIMVVNTTLAFIQEYKAELALRLLSHYLIVHTTVRRDGKEIIIESNQLVPGDVVILNPGDIVPADMRLVETNNFSIDESVLTGESAPQNKVFDDPKFNYAYLGTSVSQGSGIGIVITIGADTQFGQISKLTLATTHESTFTQRLTSFSTFLIKLSIFLLVIVLLMLIIIKSNSISLNQLFLFAVALVISLTPEALPIVTTLSLTQGALKLAKSKVIIKRLSAIEELGSITLLATDKTGTLTLDKLTVSDSWKYKEALFDPLLLTAITKVRSHENNFEHALYEHLNQEQKKELAHIDVLQEIPFDPVYRRTTKLVTINSGNSSGNSKKYIITKGILQEIVKLCVNISPKDFETIEAWEQERGKLGQRVLGVAIKEITDDSNDSHDIKLKNGFMFAGMVSFSDPIKPTAAEAIKNAQKLGITIKILTGDSLEVASAVARTIGLISLENQVISGAQLDKLGLEDKKKYIQQCTVFARVTPQQKFEIIQYLKTENTVGYMGDGINDAPALKASHVGIVVAHATQIAQSAADIVLTAKSLSTVVNAIMIGRNAFANITKYIKITLTCNMGNVFTIALSSLLLPFLPMLPVQILLSNLITDLPVIFLATDKVDAVELKKPSEFRIDRIALVVLLFGAISSFFDFLIFAFFYNKGEQVLQTAWFIMTIVTEILIIFSLRTKLPVWKARPPSLSLLILSLMAILLGIGFTFVPFAGQAFKLVPLSHVAMGYIIFIACAYFITNEIVKIWYYRSTNKK